MDDQRIRQLTEDVLSKLAGPAGTQASDIESRVTALEAAVRDLRAGRSPVPAALAPAAAPHAHPSFHLLDVPAGGERCVVEPEKPCVRSGQCRILGH